MTSIRTFLVFVLLATMTLVTFTAALRGYRSSMQQTERLFDRQLQDLADLLDEFSGTITGSANMPGNNTPDSSIAFQVWSNGSLLHHSINTPETPIVPFEAGYHETNFASYRWRTLAKQTSRAGRWIFVAERTDVRSLLEEDVILEAVTPIIFGLPVAGVLIWLIVGYGMRPLNRLARELGTRTSDDLTPLSADQTPAELMQVIRSINAFLSRLAAAIGREQRFAADAAHELRTPISVLKVHLHNLAHELSPGDPNVMRLKDGIDRMGHLVEQILALHSTAPDQFMANFKPLDLHALAREVISRQYRSFAAREQQIELVGSDAQMIGDRFALETLLQNLLSNAGKYTPTGGRILVTVQPDARSVTLQIEDSGPGIPIDEHEQVFERFHRVGGDRHASTQPGCGLGLAIVQHIAELHDATIVLGPSSFDDGLLVRIKFPVSSSRSGARHG